MHEAGKIIIILGAILILVGAILLLGWGGAAFGWLGRLPGDIRIEKDNTRIYIPIATSIVLSIILSLAMWIIARLRGA
jgi:hypothetical protein